MEKFQSPDPKIPLTEKLKTIPDILGIRLNEQPKFELIKKDGPVEIRKYEKMLIARVTVPGDHETATKDGFKQLASYIFGDNQSNENIEMTAPVFHEDTQGSWTSTFVLPKKILVEKAPIPNNSTIRLIELEERIVLSFEYGGTNDEANKREAAQEFQTWLDASQYRPHSAIRWAQYDPPFTIPFVKKNEVHIDIDFE